MFLSKFWDDNGINIILSSVFILISISLLIVLIINLGKQKSKKINLIGGIIFLLVLLAVNTAFVRDYFGVKAKAPEAIFPYVKVLLFNSFIILLFVIIGYIFSYKKDKFKDKMSISKLSSLAAMLALASVLMLFSIPIFPSFSYLKVEISALIYFMVFLWFGTKPAISIVLLTNIIHIIMPSMTPPVVFGLDESANVVACLIFLTPSFIMFRKLPKDQEPEFKKVVISSILGVLTTAIFMVFYNYLIFIPIYENIFQINMGFDFNKTLIVFGAFNLIKWSVVCTVVVLLYRKLFSLKDQLMKH